jgi:hypothetical protein
MIAAQEQSINSDALLSGLDIEEKRPLVEEDHGELDEATLHQREEAKSLWVVMFVSMPIFMGYAALNALQRKIKLVLDISDDDHSASLEFGNAVSFLYIGNLIFRLMHNIIFSPFQPRQRVYISFMCMGLSMLCISVFIFLVPATRSIAWVYACYVLGGVAIGSFESNLMSVITPHGHGTKSWAVTGLPVGYCIINIGSFLLMMAAPDSILLQAAQYWLVLIGLAVGAYIFMFHVPDVPMEGNSESLGEFWTNLKQVGQWGPLIWANCFALMVDMAGVSMFSSLTLYIFDTKHISIAKGVSITKDLYMALFNTCSFLGDTLSRKLAYRSPRLHPFWFLIATAAGAAMCLSRVALLSILGVFLVFFANGSIYAHTTRHIDGTISDAHHLIAMSGWLFVGDIGSVTASNLVQFVKEKMG